MSRSDCVTALSTELADAASIISRTVAEAGVEVDAVVAMPDHESWPGLLGELADRLSLPVVALDGGGDESEGGRHTDLDFAGVDREPVPPLPTSPDPVVGESDSIRSSAQAGRRRRGRVG